MRCQNLICAVILGTTKILSRHYFVVTRHQMVAKGQREVSFGPSSKLIRTQEIIKAHIKPIPQLTATKWMYGRRLVSKN